VSRKLSKFPFPNCQNFHFQTVKISISKMSKFPNCQNFLFQTVKISPSKLSKFSFLKLSNFPIPNNIKQNWFVYWEILILVWCVATKKVWEKLALEHWGSLYLIECKFKRSKKQKWIHPSIQQCRAFVPNPLWKWIPGRLFCTRRCWLQWQLKTL
jgi:hypothetical protein